MANQPDLFSTLSEPVDRGKTTDPVANFPDALSADSRLSAALAPYQAHMYSTGMSENTIKAFLGDIRLLGKFLQEKGASTRLKDIGTETLNRFLYWLKFERTDADGAHVPCSPKSYARRVTSLKSFFGWLGQTSTLPTDPAAPVLQESAQAPLPRILYDDEIERLMRATRDQLWSTAKPDARPHLLVLLMLQTALKKGEVVSIRLEDIDSSNVREPVLFVRYSDGRHGHKERKLSLGPAFAPVLSQYLRNHKPKEHLFECTARNLEYVLDDAAAMANIKDGVSFEMLRWTSAVRSYRFGTPPEALRLKLGLSPISWRETFEKIKKLASPGL